MVRAPRFDINGMKKGAWSEDEDNKLTAYIQQHGYPANWRELPKLAGLSRCGKSCRLRWKNHLDPTKKHGKFTKEEEDKIILLHKKFGNKWSMMAAQMPGRSDTEIKNHFNTRLKNRIPLDPDVSNNQHCDQNLEPQDHVANPKSTTQQEIDVLIAVLSSSSINKDSSPCQSSGHATDLPVIIPSDDILRVSDTAGDVWTDELFNSPLRVGCDFVPFETSWPDYNVMDDLVLWSTLFQSPDPPVDPVKLPVFQSTTQQWVSLVQSG